MGRVVVTNACKKYGDTFALDNISLTIEENKIYGLLGRNGAGKTTLLNAINKRIFLNEGTSAIDNNSLTAEGNGVEKIYFMTEQNLYPQSMKVKELFSWTKEFYPNFDRAYALELCKKFELNINKKIKELSTGYSSICKIINTMASGAEILMFDEPVLGLDANNRDMFYKELMESYIEKPKTIIISTHIIEEVAQLIERVVIIKDGKLIVEESVEELLKGCYCVSGLNKNIDAYIRDKNCINVDEMVAFKSAIIIGENGDAEKKQQKELDLEVSKVELQKLFIHLTSIGEIK
ncbi:ABC transporter ATP-binding protein [Clostridium tagluense]|uniref:ATP-binding cassette domain-containing protein n=1 Tax=Clostridium tagluense TaxID=360422 RepID=UPI001C0D3B12|nr:ABC transporter ATP-binding protein [Clostridium tagluense]MBU3128788.1 ABC transporter ATP-binding protein [Clostridium tagluense]MCB2313039.1 ABC transporter ATP-binding protein [Clostridium tagluense]MCB2317852.1 ABC transporter ATP-binding protein [Clostridium tagluense]MCB2322637.1 ABC transporter ATP-binding protein [Clostridium tagluense]MCB2327588.1 ABC transporter ATP-binding protein [Clostridium tagluense]